MKRVLLIEDEKNMSRFIELELRREGFAVTTAEDGEAGLLLALHEGWDVVLLDVMLPRVGGFEVCRRIRDAKRVPIIMITARDRLSDRVEGLDSGADDYIAKPFAIDELLARMRAVLRREGDNRKGDTSALYYGELMLHADTRTIMRGSESIELTKREFALLEAFMKNPGRVLSREVLLDTVWGFDAVVDKNVVDVYVRYLRGKIDRGGEDSYIQSVRGVGYVMRR
ncbi:response regulator transcription factor [Paenibacillus chungangensis]|uniref:Response regulator transcription factor n=1 Tax=Paenibacillus chungangensis TaxID=696535 RepID=A0ABW3HUJ2_9BACL